MKNTITIAGGGLAGLALGIALRQRGIPVIVHEATTYPRHRVCGEFVNGVTEDTLAELGIRDLLEGAHRHRATRWYRGGEEVLRAELPRPALGLSRYRCDDLLQCRLQELGGRLLTRSRLNPEPAEGFVWAAGRRLEKSGQWVGLKCHVSDLELSGDLEMHLGTGAYVGMTPIEEGRVNVCGLFPKSALASGEKKVALFLSALQGCGMGELGGQLESASIHEESFVGAAGFELGRQRVESALCTLGDSEAIIPPFTGNGMSMAFEAAECALEPLSEYAVGRESWDEVRDRIAERLRWRFRVRLGVARVVHPLFLHPMGQAALISGARSRLLPFRLMHAVLT